MMSVSDISGTDVKKHRFLQSVSGFTEAGNADGAL